MTSALKKSKAALLILCIGLLSFNLSAQTLSIDSCYALAKKNYPLVKQFGLIEKTEAYSLQNAGKGNLPQISINGQATYQSAVTQVPVPSVAPLSKDQYKIYGEVNQSLTDQFTIREQKKLVEANANIEDQKLEVDLYQLKERINQLFFGTLLIDAQIEQTDLLKKDIQSGIDKTQAAIENGTALKINADLLQAELLKVEQRKIELVANRNGFTDMLSLFINRPIDENVKLSLPIIQTVSTAINRPELMLFEIQKESLAIQNQLIRSRNLPRLNLFFQGGYGRPALNVLDNNFDMYYIGGIKLNWNISGYYTSKNERQLITLNRTAVDLQKETFLFNTQLSMAKENNEISKNQELIQSDNKIIALREKVKTAATSQLENGTITANDYLTYVNAEDQARQNLMLHKIQLLLAKYTYQTTTGN